MQIVRLTVSNRLSVILLLIAALIAPLIGVATPASAVSTIRINFQAEEAAVPLSPERYMRDYGLGYGPRTKGEAAIIGVASEASGFSYGWVVPGTTNPRSMVGEGRIRDPQVSDQRFRTLLHMQRVSANPGAWEIALANGSYDVTVAVGEPDGTFNDSSHTIRLEGQTVISQFVASGASFTSTRSTSVTARVNVGDGRLTVDAEGGTNTKIHYIDIVPVADPNQPYVQAVLPTDGATGVLRNVGITATVVVPTGGIRAATVNNDTVQLRRASDNSLVPAAASTTAGGDAITLQPNDYLEPNTTYIFSVSDGVEAVGGKKFRPFASTFTTGTGGGPGGGDETIAFDMVGNVAQATQYSSLAIGPDNRLYAAALTGHIYRYDINANGTLSNQTVINTVREGGRGNRAIIGIAFDPAATAQNLILWISHNGPYVQEGAPDWTGAIARLTGPNLENFQDYVINLPHSYKDHMSNSIAFGPDGKIYISIGSNSAMGAVDNAWGNRPERLLTAAILRVDQTAISNPPLNVKTEDGGNYNPFAPNAPVKLYATGVRNAYDLVWHSNGQLYVPTNGSAAGGNSPATPSTLPASCSNRINGQPYTGGAVPALNNIRSQRDFLYRVVQGGYYGHPNPTRCEWVLNGGNPTSGANPQEVVEYPVGTQPDPNFRGIAYDFNLHKSPNGAIEYKSNAFGGALKGWLIVTRYSQNKDLIALRPGGPNLDIVEARERIQGTNNSFVNSPLDVIEDTRNGNLYVIQFAVGGPSYIALLRPVGDSAARIKIEPTALTFTDVATSAGNAAAGPAQQLRIENIGQNPLTISSLTMVGSDAGQFSVVSGGNLGSLPATIPAGESRTVNVAFTAATPGPKFALLRVNSNAVNASTLEVVLRGLGTAGTSGSSEPSLQWILDTYEIKVTVGDDNPATNIIHSNTATATSPLLGDEIAAQLFQRADNATPVTIEPIAVFGPTQNNPVVRFGWYTRSGAQVTQNQLFQVSNSPTSNGQRLAPVLESGATLSFDPGTGSFGFYSTWPFFSNRNVFSQDDLNTWEQADRRHKVRVYPLKDSTGATVPDAYVIATEEHTSGFDYQDVVIIARNIKPAGSTPPPVNNPPTANAGADRSVIVGSSVTLDGNGADVDGDTLSYSWVRTAGPNVTLSNANAANPTFTAPASPTSLTFELTVSDGRGGTAKDTVVITVVNSPIGQLNAGSSSPTVLGQATTFTASATGGSNVGFSWNFGDGNTTTGANVSHTYLQEGTYVAVVTAQNGGPAVTANVTVQVTNAAPIARAGADVRVPVTASVTLNGGTSSDPDGHTPLTFSWRQVSGGPVTLSNPNAAQVSFTAPNAPDTLEFELTVTDSKGKQGTDRVQVIVEAANRPNTTPVANAGPDGRVAVGKPVNLSGALSFDPDGDALSYAWSQVSGPVVNLGSAADIALNFTAPNAPATLIFELTVTDAYGKSAADQVLVLVESANRLNTAPTANAGPDRRTPVGAEVLLDARASSDAEADVLTFAWAQVGGPAVTLNSSGAQARFFAPAAPTTLEFEVTVTDAFGAAAKDRVKVQVVAAASANNPPTANAGPDQRAPVTTLVSLDARGSSDQDGDNLIFTWRQVSGPSVRLSNTGSATPQLVTPATPGTLVFEVTVTDAFGGNNSDQMTLTVGPAAQNGAPVARTGAAQQVPAGSNVRLDATTSTDPNGDPLRYSWRQVSGPSVALVGAGTARPAFAAPNHQGSMIFEVTVTDTFGASSTARVMISVVGSAPTTRIYLPLIRR